MAFANAGKRDQDNTPTARLAARHSGKSLIAFDLDGTLTPSTTVVPKEMAAALAELLQYKKVAVVSGRGFDELERRVVDGTRNELKAAGNEGLLKNLIIMPSLGSVLYEYKDGKYTLVYSDRLTKAEKTSIEEALARAIAKAPFEMPPQSGSRIIDRESSMALLMLGDASPQELRENWDPDKKKRSWILAQLQDELGDRFSIAIGGRQTLDVSRKGVDKGYGMEKLMGILSIGSKDVLFVGDSLFDGGNDQPVKRTGIDTLQVSSPKETQDLVEALIKNSMAERLLRQSGSGAKEAE